MSIESGQRLGAAELGELCLGHLVEDPRQLAEFMLAAGLDPDALRRAIGTAELAAGLIGYYGQNEALMLALCSNAGIRPEQFMRVYYQLNPAG